MAASVAGAPEHWALDPAHESFSAQPVGWAYLRVWSWAHLDYVVRRCVVSSLGRKVTPAPPDPDAALQPDRTLFRRGARQMVNVYGLEGQDAAATEMHPAIAHLRDSGEWLTAGDLAAWAGIKPGSMAGIIAQYRSQLDAWPQQIYKGGRAYRVTYYRWKRGGQ